MHIYILLMLKILYYLGMLKNLWILCNLCYCICLLFQNGSIFLIHQQKLQLMDFF